MYKVQSIGPVSKPQWTEEAKEKQRLGPDQSILSFLGYPCSHPPTHPSFPFPSPPSFPTDQHQANLSRQRWGAAMQVIKATTVMATNHWGNCCSNQLCSMLSAILSTISFINGMWCHSSDYTPCNIWFKCVLMPRERTKVSTSNMPHVQPRVISSQHFLSLIISSMTESVWVEGNGQNHSPLWLCMQPS